MDQQIEAKSNSSFDSAAGEVEVNDADLDVNMELDSD